MSTIDTTPKRRGFLDFLRPRKWRYVCDLDIIGPQFQTYPFARADIDSLLNMIVSRLSNATFHASNESIYFNRCVEYLKRHSFVILKELFENGSYDIRIDVDEPVTHVISPYTLETGDTMENTLRPYLRLLDVIMNATLNLTENYGALGILSPTNSSLSDGFIDADTRKELQEEYNKAHGITLGKWNLLITKQDVKFQPINLPIEALKLSDRRKDALSSILQFLNIPKELHSAFENSKYANRAEAERDCYNNCIATWAQFFCKVLERLYAVHPKPNSMPRSIDVWFEFENVSALSEQKQTDMETLIKNYEFWDRLSDNLDTEISGMAQKRIKEILEQL